ncbi:DUF4150 domain-containing protein [Pyxidicoccus xibeiensis]|uniref:DUF4150 domain-containing protein n=1 Tax=Pyxidicoccus xibeiensis TaxID=2906759 RepID=UPI0020A74C6B|nr:DUF4150 domain-containing protein [Pyxidicoccus xibeiensis]MCP3136627.1 DUF4150 domain-containing protein [Pyxidicoccus xibeiensis]
MSKVFANGRSIAHKGDGQTNTCAVPDVCKTPSPAGPVPVPYVNVAQDSNLAQGSTSVQIAGNAVALKDSNLSTSSGDEPGSAGGLISSKNKGKMTWGSFSLDVKFEGKGVVRFLDATQHNGNTFNSAFIQMGGTGFAYGDDPVEGSNVCPLCDEDKATHRILETPSSLALGMMLLAKMEEVRAKQQHLQIIKARGGYMIGVLSCKCGQKLFVAMSGQEVLPGFAEAVDKLKKEDSRWTLCGNVDLSQMRNGNGLIPNSAAFFTDASRIGARSNAPGMCAAPKLLQDAQKAGHRPGEMTEIFYFPPETRTGKRKNAASEVEVTFQRTVEGETNQVMEKFTHGQTVPSCATCQIQLTPMLCSNQDPCS